jgi:hypothetical protein
MMQSSVAALSSFYPAARNIFDQDQRNISVIRLLAKTPTIAAFSYRHSKGLPVVYPDNSLSYVENFLSMINRMTEPRYEANPTFARALEVLFILHADHEQNCSTSAVRVVGSSHVDPFSAMSAGVAALFGPLHGGANEQVLRMIEEIGTIQNVPAFIETVKSGSGKLMGFGHRVYKSYDPRAKIVKKLADSVFKITGVARARANRAAGRLLRVAQALSERRFLHRFDLPLDGLPNRVFHGAFRDCAHGGMAVAVGRDAAGQGTEDRSSAPDLYWPRRASVCADDQRRYQVRDRDRNSLDLTGAPKKMARPFDYRRISNMLSQLSLFHYHVRR